MDLKVLESRGRFKMCGEKEIKISEEVLVFGFTCVLLSVRRPPCCLRFPSLPPKTSTLPSVLTLLMPRAPPRPRRRGPGRLRLVWVVPTPVGAAAAAGRQPSTVPSPTSTPVARREPTSSKSERSPTAS